MSSKLKAYFPCIWEREELMEQIKQKKELSVKFSGWKPDQQQEFLDFCTGMRGLKILYDPFFKEIMNPEYTPEHLSDFLSEILQKKVLVKAVLPNDSTRISDENSLLITDIVVELEDGTLANVEVQKIGYMFPGERSACYSSDLLLRQYKRIRSRDQKKFSYYDIKDVYVIVLFEKSTKEFKKFPEHFLHSSQQVFDTGLQMNLLQKYRFIPLDIFRNRTHNKLIKNKLEAWLTFLSAEHPEDIIRLIESYPEFRPLYQQVYDLCRNLEDVMGLFSEELLMMDRNTVQLMIDEMQEEINQQSEALSKQEEMIAQQKDELERALQRIKELENK